MNDIARHVVIAETDINLLPLDLERPVAARCRGRFQCTDVGACLRLGQVHRAGPFAADQLWQIGGLLRVRSVVMQRLNRTQRQQRTQSKRHVGTAQRIERNGRQCIRQPLPPMFHRRID